MTNPRKAVILVVDDEVNTVTLLRDVLSLNGYHVVTAYDGADGLAKARQCRPDAILLDIGMPQMDGWAVCQKLKASPSTTDIPVIFVSALSQRDDKMRGEIFGAADYLTKPLDIQQLLGRLANIIPKKAQ